MAAGAVADEVEFFTQKENKKIKNLSTKKHAEIRGWYKVTAGGFSSRGEKTKCPLFFGCKLHAVNMVNCKTVLDCSLQLEATKLDKT